MIYRSEMQETGPPTIMEGDHFGRLGVDSQAIFERGDLPTKFQVER